MPTYVYKDSVTGEIFEVFQSMKDEPLTINPATGNPCEKQITAPTIIDGLKTPKTLGALAEKNTAEKLKRGEITKRKEPPKPWWRKEEKPLNTRGWSEKQKKKYIMEGKKP
jgi:hypothetical protein